MNKRYDPEKMIAKSRFSDFFASWGADEKQWLIERMQRLLAENAEYADAKNEGHLCNLITSLAMVLTLEQTGQTRQEAQDTVAAAMYSFIQPQIASMQKLASHGWFVGLVKIAMPIKFRHTLGHGWNVEFPQCPRNTFSMTTHSCIYHQLFSKYGMPEMTAVFCKVDDILYSNLPRAQFRYTEQIGTGGTMCDYTFTKR